MCYFPKVIIFGGPWSKKTSWMANEMRDTGVKTSVRLETCRPPTSVQTQAWGAMLLLTDDGLKSC